MSAFLGHFQAVRREGGLIVGMREHLVRGPEAAVPIYVWRLDGTDLTLDGFNDAALTVTSGGVRTLLGRRAAELYADAPDVLDLFHRCLEGRTSVRQRLAYRFRSVAKSADLDVTCTWVPPDRVAVAAVEEPHGGGPAHEAGRFLSSVLANLPAGMAYRCRADAERTMLYVSDGCAALTGYAPAELLGNHEVAYAALIHEDDAPQVRARAHAALAEGHPFEASYRIRHRDGRLRWVWEQGRGVGGPPVPMVEGLVLDITEARETEEQLRRVQGLDAVGQLSAGIAHDFNNLLSVILLDAELAKSELPPDAPSPRTLLEDIEQVARSGGALVRKFSALARRTQLAIEATDLRDVLTEAQGLIRRVIPENIELRVRLGPSVRPALADGGAIQQILLNLVLNARDAMPDGGVLAVELAEAEPDGGSRERHPWVGAGPHACVTVSDNGIGMDPAVQQRMFDLFFTTKPPDKGTGLGMAMVYGLVKQHRGAVHVHSKPGLGTTVRVYVPLAAAEEPAGAAVVEPDAPAGTETVLLVEDEAPVREAARRALAHLGYTVVTAADGVEALSVLNDPRTGIEVVLSDLVLPRQTGIELFRALRTADRGLPFVLMTGDGANDMPGWAELASDAVLVQKPWTTLELARAVRQALDRGVAPA